MKLNIGSMKITTRDVKFFLIGVVTTILAAFFMDLDNNIKDVKDGFNGARSERTNVLKEE